MAGRRFSQTEILKKLDARCEKCKVRARDSGVVMTLHHRDHSTDNGRWENIEVLCRKCHSMVEGTNLRKKDLR